MKASLDGMMADPRVPVAGDLLRLAFHAARFHPDAQLRTQVGEAIDRMLDAADAKPFPAREAMETLALAKGTALAPMVASAQDAALAARCWRLASVEAGAIQVPGFARRDTKVFVGSADAVGAGHGALLGEDRVAQFHPRAGRPTDGHWIHLGIARKPTDLALARGGDEATLEVEQGGGIAIACMPASSPGPDARWDEGFLAIRRDDGTIDHQSLRELGLKAEQARDGRARLSPASPEAAIRLASACTQRPLVLLESSASGKAGRGRIVGSFDMIVELAPLAEAPCRLACVRRSRDGMLAQWMSMPRAVVALALDPAARAAIAAHYATT